MGKQAISAEWEEKPNEPISPHFLQKILHTSARFTAHLIIKIRPFNSNIYTWLADKFKVPWKRRRGLNRLSTWVRERNSSLLYTFLALSGVP